MRRPTNLVAADVRRHHLTVRTDPRRPQFSGSRREIFSGNFALLLALLIALIFCAHRAAAQAEPSNVSLYGTNFTISVPNVDVGQYTAVFGFMENQFDAAGQRLFDISYQGHLIASNLDVFAAAGGRGKFYSLAIPLTHAADIEGGPLAFTFIARKNLAMFCTLELKTSSGTRLFLLTAADVMNPNDNAATKVPAIAGPLLWKDATLLVDIRVKDLVSRMSLAEKVAQLRNGAPPISRLGLPAYDYRNECLHGVANAGVATVFPQAIGMAATWDTNLIHQVADAIATEARAKHNAYANLHEGDSVRYVGLTFWTPNINLFRDPRWGRGQETYGEDPFLTSQMAVAFIRGLQGNDPKYFKALACAKHFAVHSGPEITRYQFDAQISDHDLFDSYLPQFEAAVKQGHVGAVMGAYNSLDGEPACSNPFLLTELLRNQWGFNGHVVSDCGAITNIFLVHKIVATPEEAAARALKAGCDLCCGAEYNDLVHAAQMGLVTEQQIDLAAQRVLASRFKLGLFDPPELVPYAQIPITENDSPAHAQLALQTARESLVLLKNDGLLPLQREKLKRMLVVGTNAVSVPMLLGNYNGTASKPITVLDGIKSVAGNAIEIIYEPGCPLASPKSAVGTLRSGDTANVSNAVEIAKSADAIIYVGGLSPSLEGEDMPVDFDGFAGGDRTRIELPAPQTEFLKALHATAKPVVFVNCSGSAVAMPWEAKNVPAILQAWYPGEAGGRAVAEVLFGDINPAGRLPITFYSATGELPAFENYSMSNRTYRYYQGAPEFAFGHGLSFAHFNYGHATLNSNRVSAGATLKLSFTITNTGSRDGDEVPQVYFHRKNSQPPDAKEALCGFTRVHLAKSETKTVTLEIPLEKLRTWSTAEKRYVIETGAYELLIGAASDEIKDRLPLEVTLGK
jgi:beta-glucosidase